MEENKKWIYPRITVEDSRIDDALFALELQRRKILDLKKQIKNINQADITTIDSFCLKIVRNYFHLINIDPDFRIAESAECELIKDEVIEELFDEQYSDEKFIKLAFMLTDGRETTEVSELVKDLFNFTRSLPDPDKWFEEKEKQICINRKSTYDY
jgi:ATP-dependent helicase/nuclease subunit A